MKKPMIIMLSIVLGIFVLIVAYNTFVDIMMSRFFANLKRVYTVSSMTADYSEWQPQHDYYGSMKAVLGINLTTELAGLVQKVYFFDGERVKKGQLLVQLNAATELGALHSTQANAALALVTLRRDTAQYAIKAISKQTLDTDRANYKSLLAQTAQQQATVNKKAILAPFSGRVGISVVNPGQYVNVGDTIAPLQKLDPIYVNFYVPQQDLVEIKVGQPVTLKIDAFPKQIFKGKINAINPVIDISTRNVEVEALISNPNYTLTPGMFAAVTVDTGAPKKYLTLPQAAISYNAYGNLIYKLKATGKDKEGNQLYVATQSFVTLGSTRGDQVAVLSGLQKGDIVVTAGQLKLKNGATVKLNNSVEPKNNPAPNVREE